MMPSSSVWGIGRYTINPGKKKRKEKGRNRNMAGKEYNTANPYLKHPIEE